MSSDYFIIPTAPDFFCAQAIKSLSKVLPRWNKEIHSFRDESLIYPFPNNPPKFIGSISQKYRPKNGSPVKSFQKWIDIIQKEIVSSLVPSLAHINMTIGEDIAITADGNFNLANIADFNSLIAQSQQYNIPVFNLSDTQIEQVGVVLDTMRQSRDNFKISFTDLAILIHKLTERIQKC